MTAAMIDGFARSAFRTFAAVVQSPTIRAAVLLALTTFAVVARSARIRLRQLIRPEAVNPMQVSTTAMVLVSMMIPVSLLRRECCFLAIIERYRFHGPQGE